jgi:hypothetical protein
VPARHLAKRNLHTSTGSAKRFRKKHQTVYTDDGASIEAEWNFGKGIERRMYSLGVYDEGLLVGCKEGRELVEWLKKVKPDDLHNSKELNWPMITKQ